MFGTVPISCQRTLAEYQETVGEEALEELSALARPLRGARLLNLSVTAFGTGVADFLSSIVPLTCDLGMDCRWQVIRAAEEFNVVNKGMYHALSGGYSPWRSEMSDVWLKYNEMNAGLLTEDYDFIIIHDPQPAGIVSFLADASSRRAASRWVWHCHLDLSQAQHDVWVLLRPHIERYDAVVFQCAEFAPGDLRQAPVHIITPAIDPLAPRNMNIDDVARITILERYGIDPQRPLVCQVSPISEWADSLGAIDAFQLAQKEMPGLQLVLVSPTMPEDPANRAYLERVMERAAAQPDIHILSCLDDIGNVEVNVLQRSASVILQRALGKGFGLWLSEGLWKERPVVAGRSAGTAAQVVNGENGYLCTTTEECAEKMLDILKDSALAQRLGEYGRQHVRQHFIITRFLRDYLNLLGRLISERGLAGYRSAAGKPIS